MLRFVSVALLLVSLASCDAGDSGGSSSDGLSGNPALLAGTWTWEKSVVCSAGGCTETTPASSGRTETLTFTHTPETSSHNGMVTGFFNGYPVGPTTYLVEYGSDGSTSLALGEGGGYNEFGVSRDRLVISATAVDGEETTYRRR